MAYLIIIGLAVLCVWFLWTMKVPKYGNLVLTTGGVKTGKTMLSVYFAYKAIKKAKMKVRFQNYIIKTFRLKKPLKEIPHLYSNIPLKVPHVPLTDDLLKRKKRFAYGSVVYICESSLVADSMAYKDDFTNEQLLLLNKLIAHETKGGYMFYDTQAIGDNHYAIKRCLSTYFYIHHSIKWVPFFVIMYVRELKYSDDNSAVNTFEADVEDSLKRVIVPKKVWKIYDCYCYSILTDHLPVVTGEIKAQSLKAEKILSFKKFKNLYGKSTEEGEKTMTKRRNYGVLFDHIFWFSMMVLPIFIFFITNYHNPTPSTDFFAFVETFSPFSWLANILDEVTVTAWGETFALSRYLAYAFGVELCHVIYDVCAFIPRLAHKWIGRAVQND